MSHSSVGSTQNLRTGDPWFDPWLGQYSFLGIDDSPCNRIHSSLTTVHFHHNGYTGKQPVAWKEYCAEYWVTLYQTQTYEILDRSKLKAFADNNLNIAKMIIILYDRVENIVGKGENAGYQHFLLFPQCFQKAYSQGCKTSGLCGKELKEFQESMDRCTGCHNVTDIHVSLKAVLNTI